MLREEQVRKYWEQRATEHGAQAVGFSNKPLDFQLKMCEERKKFIFPHCPRSLRTLDFGCGTGNFADCFESYLGMDINETFLSFAKKTHPEKNFILLEQPIPSEKTVLSFQPELFFSATVLQHNSDELVEKIFKSIAQIGREITFSLYENSQVKTGHVKGRTSEEYLELFDKDFKVLTFRSFSHYVHNEEHSLTLVEVRPL